MSDVPLTRPDGVKVTVPQEEVQTAIARGYKPSEPAAASSLSEGVKHFGMGVLDVPTLGQGMAALDLLNPFDSQTTENALYHAQQNKGARLAGNVVGAAPLAAVAEAGVLATGLQGAKAAVATGSLVGGITGFEQEVTEAQLDNKPLTGEGAAIATLKGALLGGGTSGLTYGVGKGLKAIAGGLEKVPTSDKSLSATIRESGEEFLGSGHGLISGEEIRNSIGVGLLKSPPAGLAAAGGYMAKNVARGHGAILAADAIEAMGGRSISTKAIVNGISNAVSTAGDAIISGAPTALAPFLPVLEQAMAKGDRATVEAHQKLIGEFGPEYVSAVGGKLASPVGMDDARQRAAQIDALHEQTEVLKASVGRGMDDFFHGKGSKYKASDVDFKAASDMVKKLKADPSVMIPEHLWSTAPGVAMRMMETQQAALEHLDSVMPKNPYFGMPKAIQPPWRASAADEDQFKRIVAVVQDPLTLLGQLRQGVAGPKEAEAVEKVYPQLFDEMKIQMLQRLQVWDKPLEYNKRLALSQVFGPQFLGIGLHEAQLVQQVHAEMQAPAEGSKGPDGRQKIDVDRNLQTQAQRLEGR